jgi:hypothetical protein
MPLLRVVAVVPDQLTHHGDEERDIGYELVAWKREWHDDGGNACSATTKYRNFEREGCTSSSVFSAAVDKFSDFVDRIEHCSPRQNITGQPLKQPPRGTSLTQKLATPPKHPLAAQCLRWSGSAIAMTASCTLTQQTKRFPVV